MSDLFGNHIVGFSTRWLKDKETAYPCTSKFYCIKLGCMGCIHCRDMLPDEAAKLKTAYTIDFLEVLWPSDRLSDSKLRVWKPPIRNLCP